MDYEQSQYRYKLAFLEQFDVNSVSSFGLPTRNCQSSFNSLDGLLYLVPESTSDLFYRFQYTNRCYAGLQIEDRNGEQVRVPGVMCYSQYDRDVVNFKAFSETYMPETTNITRYMYFVRQPIFYKMTKISYKKGDRLNVYPVFEKNLGQYTMCNDADTEEKFTITINYKKIIDFDFESYKLFPCLYSELESDDGFNRFNDVNLPGLFEILDKDNNYAPRKIPISRSCIDNLPYTSNIQIKVDLGTTIPPHSCASAKGKVLIRRYDTQINATFNVHLANMGNFTDHTTLRKSATIIEYEKEDVILDDIKISGRNSIIIIIPLYVAYLILGCVVGMIFFCLLLFTVIKSMNYVDKANFRDNWYRTSERFSAAASNAAEFTKAKGAILGDKLIRLGDYICNVGHWIYLEIEK
uniref:Uncharacterized protein n=1 Tax=Phlebotomus papatasi TaxID=29031 RepID=A0A1B0D537_PHLPP